MPNDTPSRLTTNLRRLLRAGSFLVLLAAFAVSVPALPVNAEPALTELEGRIVLEHGDDVARGKAVAYRVLETRTERLTLEGRGAAGLRAGTKVTLKGERRGNRFLLSDNDPVLAMSESGDSTGTYAASTTTTNQKRLAVLLVNFAADLRQPWTQVAVRDVVFDSSSSAAAYWHEVSNAQMSLSGDVFGYYTLSSSTSSCDYNGWMSAAKLAAQAAGVDLSGYTNVMLAFPRQPACAWSGLGSLSGPNTWLNGSISTFLAVHELGHNFGAHHASTLSCTDASGARVAFSDSCTQSEYGDPFDAMGNGTRHGNSFHRRVWGFLGTGDQKTVTSTGTYTVAPAATAGGSPRILRVARPSGSYFYVEYRRPYGTFDAYASSAPAVNGVMIRLGPDTTREQSKLVDATPATTSFSDAALAAGKTFSDPVAGITITTVSLSESGASVRVAFGADGATVPPADTQAPTSPAGLAASRTGDTSVSLTWAAATDNVGVAGYKVARDGVLLASLPASATSFADSNLSPATTYTYAVTAFDAAGNNGPAATISYTTPSPADTQAPSAPGNLRATGSGTSLTLSWTPATDNVGVAGYKVTRDGVLLASLAGSATSFADSNLSPATTYTYVLTAFDAAGNKSPTATIRYTTPSPADTQAPSAPGNLRATGSGTSVTLSWTPATDNVGVVEYRVRRDGVLIAKLGPSVTRFDNTALRPGVTYTYKVVALDAAGNRSAARISYTVPDTSPPTTPTSLKGTTSGGKVFLSWGASSDNSGSVKYQIFRGTRRVATVSTTSYSGSPEPGKYTYRVRAVDASRNVSSFSNSVTLRVGS